MAIMTMEAETFEERVARRRATWTISVSFSKDGAHPAMQASDSTLVERVLWMQGIAELGWAFSGKALPDYPRDAMPGQVIRPGARSRR